MAAEIDSQQYATAFALRSPQDIPVDFKASMAVDEFLAGMFLPRDPPDWFGRSPYPARAVILARDGVSIHAHPGASQAPVRIPLRELVVVELGHFLLHGWVKFVAAGAESMVRYNTTNQRVVDGFLMRLRTAWLPPASPVKPCLETNVPELKFRYGLWVEIRPDEQICCTLFNRSGVLKRRPWWRPYTQRHPGDLLALTTKRLLWITDRYRGRCERYGTVTSYAPISRIGAVHVERRGSEDELRIDFDAGHGWRVPLPLERQEGARRFAEEVGESISRRNSTVRQFAKGQT